MAQKTPTIEEIDASLKKLSKTYFARLMSLSDIVNRYVRMGLKKDVDWLRLRALIVLLTVGKGSMSPTEIAKN